MAFKEDPSELDADLTKDWLTWCDQCEQSKPKPFFNRYKTSVRYVDSMATKVLDKLKETGDLENTLVIITGDHGQEINDNKLNFWGHNSNFTNAQVNVPFVIFGPGIDSDKMSWSSNVLTSHQDVVPTLMKYYLGVTNDVKDYSVGEDLPVIGERCIIAVGAKVIGKVSIGDDSIVGANAVVTKDVPSSTVVIGANRVLS